MAVAGAKIGTVAGAAVGIETGPGVVLTGLIGCYSLNLSMVLCRENLKRRVVYGLVFVG